MGAVTHPLRPIAHTAHGSAFSETRHAKRETQRVPNQGAWQEALLVTKLAQIGSCIPLCLQETREAQESDRGCATSQHPPSRCLTCGSCSTHTQSAGNASQMIPTANRASFGKLREIRSHLAKWMCVAPSLVLDGLASPETPKAI